LAALTERAEKAEAALAAQRVECEEWDHAAAESQAQMLADLNAAEAQVAAVRALEDRPPCACCNSVGAEHHAARRGFNDALALVRAVLESTKETE